MDIWVLNEYITQTIMVVLKLVILLGIYLAKVLFDRLNTYLSKKTLKEEKLIIRALAKGAVSLAASLYKELDGGEKFKKAVEYVGKLVNAQGIKISEEEIMGVVQDAFREAKANGLLPKEYYQQENGSVINEERWSVNFSNYIFAKQEEIYYHYSFALKNISKEVLSGVRAVFQPEITNSLTTTSEFISPNAELNFSGDLVVRKDITIEQAKKLKDNVLLKILWKEGEVEKVKLFEYPVIPK